MTAIRLHVSDVSVVSSRCDNPALWRAWAQTSAPAPLAETTTSYAAIPAGVRRRLSPLGRCALSALASLKPQADEPTVWASSWGDISRTFKLTQTLSQHEDMSPADFALSVHNAVGAQAAIWLKNHASTSAVAAGPVTASCALLEAFLKLQSSPSVLVVRYEESMPELWPITTATALRCPAHGRFA